MHVGVAKTGTTYLQRILFAHRDALRSAGLLYPGARPGNQFIASLDLRGLVGDKFAHLDTDGAWDRLAREVRSHEGNVVISHETFARCSNEEVARVLASVGGADVKVIVTVRDLGRQIPAVWQETLKNRATSSYDEFLHDIFINVETGAHKFFWRPQDVSKVVRRWGRHVGMGNVTVVTVPPSGAARDKLWNRFAEAIDLPEVAIELPEVAANSSLGPAEAELLRYVNASLPDDFPWVRYARVVKRQLAENRLAKRESSRIVIPAAWHEAVHDRAMSIVAYLEGSGVRVIGDLTDLTPVLPSAQVSGPDDLTRDELMQTAAQVVRDYALTSHHRRGPADPLDAERLVGRAYGLVRRVRGLVSRAK